MTNHALAPPAKQKLLRPGAVADLFGVDSQTVGRWADSGKIESVRTLGGQRRYPETVVLALLKQGAPA